MSFEDQSCQRQFRFNGFFTRRENPTTFHDMNWIWVCCRYLSLSKKSHIVLKLNVLETHFKLYGYHNWHLKTSFVFFWEEESRVPFLQSLMGDNGHDHTLNENNWPIHKHKDIYKSFSAGDKDKGRLASILSFGRKNRKDQSNSSSLDSMTAGLADHMLCSEILSFIGRGWRETQMKNRGSSTC